MVMKMFCDQCDTAEIKQNDKRITVTIAQNGQQVQKVCHNSACACAFIESLNGTDGKSPMPGASPAE